jgi:D-3-phosphoglycerate dehydrogenase / 2-oxoglutarate reductase
MKVLICDKTEPEAVVQMQAAGLDVDVRDRITPEELFEAIPAYHAIVVRSRTKVTAPVLDKAANLKVIVRGGVGLDNIDLASAERRGISVLNTPNASSISVAELAIGYMFALARHIHQATLSMKDGHWEKKKFEGTELNGKTLGIVGLGRIGIEVARRAHALGMAVIIYDPYVHETSQGELMELEPVLKKSDYITFHLPYNDETHNLIGPAQFSMMKPGVRIIDCARGGILDEDALYDAIVSGKVAGAALDVFAEEPVYGHKLFSLDQVLGSPHIGAATKEAQARVGAEVAEKLVEFARKQGL